MSFIPFSKRSDFLVLLGNLAQCLIQLFLSLNESIFKLLVAAVIVVLNNLNQLLAMRARKHDSRASLKVLFPQLTLEFVAAFLSRAFDFDDGALLRQVVLELLEVDLLVLGLAALIGATFKHRLVEGFVFKSRQFNELLISPAVGALPASLLSAPLVDARFAEEFVAFRALPRSVHKQSADLAGEGVIVLAQQTSLDEHGEDIFLGKLKL